MVSNRHIFMTSGVPGGAVNAHLSLTTAPLHIIMAFVDKKASSCDGEGVAGEMKACSNSNTIFAHSLGPVNPPTKHIDPTPTRLNITFLRGKRKSWSMYDLLRVTRLCCIALPYILGSHQPDRRRNTGSPSLPSLPSFATSSSVCQS